MHAFRCYIFAARIAGDSGPTCLIYTLEISFTYSLAYLLIIGWNKCDFLPLCWYVVCNVLFDI